MKSILTYSEFINEDYRDVGQGSNSSGFRNNTTQLSNGGTNTIIDVIGYPSGDKRLLGLTNVTVDKTSDERKPKKGKDPDKEKMFKIRKKLSKKFNDLDKEAKNLSIKK